MTKCAHNIKTSELCIWLGGFTSMTTEVMDDVKEDVKSYGLS